EVRRLPGGDIVGKPVVPECQGLPWNVLAFAVSPNGRTLATNAYSASAVITCNTDVWNVESGALESQVGPANPVAPMSFSRDSRLLAIADNDHSATVWRANAGRAVATCPHPRGKLDKGVAVVTAVALGNGNVLATGSADHDVRLWDIRRCSKPIAVLEGHGDRVIAAAFSPAGDLLVTGSVDHTAIVWD